jgi:hypothetical protein
MNLFENKAGIPKEARPPNLSVSYQSTYFTTNPYFVSYAFRNA